MIKLKYCDKISKYGLFLDGIGRIHSPILSQIYYKGVVNYNIALEKLLITPNEYFKQLEKASGQKNLWDMMPKDKRYEITMFDIFTLTPELIEDLIGTLCFFISEPIIWDSKAKAFLINKQTKDGKTYVDGKITKENFGLVKNVCLQMADVDTSNTIEDAPVKFKNEKDRKFYEEFNKKKKKFASSSKVNENLDITNMISVICTYHNSLNYSNIFDLTVCQLHDTFTRLSISRQLSIHEHNYAVWGGKYDANQWYENIYK